ncbi:MAG: NUDIX hydrolase [Cellulomonadaceae bacterium]
MTAPDAQDARAQLAALAHGAIDLSARLARLPVTVPTRRRAAAVLMLFGRLDQLPASHRSPAVPTDLDVLLVERARTLREHAGQVAFPGGRAEPDDAGPVATALREAHEETGLEPTGVDVLGTFAPVPVPVSGHVVTPVLAWWSQSSPVRVVDAGESAAVFRCPVADLLDPANRYSGTIRHGARRTRVGPAFEVAGRIVWGFTGALLSAAFDELGWAEPWDATRRLDIERPAGRPDGEH